MELSSVSSTPVSNALDPAPPKDSRSLSSPQGATQPVGSAQQVDSTQGSSGAPDPTARVGALIDTYV